MIEEKIKLILRLQGQITLERLHCAQRFNLSSAVIIELGNNGINISMQSKQRIIFLDLFSNIKYNEKQVQEKRLRVLASLIAVLFSHT